MTRDLFRLDGTDNPQRFTWVPSPLLLTPALTLQGGAGLGAATAAMERVTGRPVIWATAQYLAEFRLARGRQLDVIETEGGRGDGSFALWARCWEGQHAVTVPDLTFIGDFMPLGFADAMGAPYAGNSLDNTIRVGNLTTTEWILLAVHVQQVAKGFGYGRAELWAQDGTLLGEVSQSAIMRLHSRIRDAGRPPRA
jgi:Thioesterase-like superfamily